MSTTYELPIAVQDIYSPTLSITEQSMEYEITAYTQCPEGCGTVSADFENLTADQVVRIAITMLNVVLYQHPELLPRIKKDIDEMRF